MHKTSFTLMGVRIDNVSMADTLRRVDAYLHSGQGHMVVTVGPEFVMRAQKDLSFKQALAEADLAVADGFGILCAAWYHGFPLFHRVTGVELVWELARHAARNRKTLFLLGGNPGTAEDAAEALMRRVPGLRIAGTSEFPWFSVRDGKPDETMPDVDRATKQTLAQIRETRPDILLVAFGAPKQEFWIRTYLRELPSVRVAIGVGGTFDFLAGKIRRAPRPLRGMGLEWLWRLIMEPRRVGRMVNAAVIFPIQVILDSLSPGQNSK